MANNFDKGNFGDSARNGALSDLTSRGSNHVFDGAGENIHCHSDSESLGSVGSRKSKTRYLNPAIYIETVESSHSVTSLQTDSCVEDVTPHPHSSYRSNSTPFLSGCDSSASSGSIRRKSCRLVGNDHIVDEVDDDKTPRNDQTYREDGPDTFRLSVASVSTTATAKEERERSEKKKKEAYKQWLARKEQEKREKQKLEKMKQMVPAPTTTNQQREESYRRWLERKRTQTERRRADEIMRHYRDNERQERERNKRETDRDEKLNVWIRKKEEEIKAMKTREERKAARAALEEEQKRANGSRAYRDWLRTSKNKPLPVPLNQGELSMRGSVSQMYVNPIPWQSSI